MNRAVPFFLAALLAVPAAFAQMPDMPGMEPHHPTEPPKATEPQPKPAPAEADHEQMEMAAHNTMHDEISAFLMRQASGTSMNPQAASEPMQMWMTKDWMLMAHGLVFVNQVFQSGPRGGDKFFSTNWFMGMAERPLGPGHLMIRSMLSLEPATITNRRYPELFQTGETAYGVPLHDAQHPHDFFMELSAEYAIRAFDTGIAYVYAAPVGDPSLGPVAYPHRASAQELPQATLSHHVQDSTHLANNVVTVGLMNGGFGGGVSAFHGGEPDEQRWDIDGGRIDSWAARVTWDPNPHWTAQLSTGHLHHPEALEPGNIQRTTASVGWAEQTAGGSIAASAIWGHNDKDAGPSNDGWLLEGLWRIGPHSWTARGEIVDKDELFPDGSGPAGNFRVKALTVGYTRDIHRFGPILAGVGGNATLYSVPSEIRPYYGSSPKSGYVYLRFRMAGSGGIESGM